MDRDDVTAWLRQLPPDEAARWLAEVLPEFADDRYFSLWESHGVHLTRCSFLSPIPELSSLDDRIWAAPSRLPGIDLNEGEQLRLLTEVFPRFRSECDPFRVGTSDAPEDFDLDNPFFAGTDALVLYCMVRHLQPAQIIEVGSGFSTKVSAAAILRNGRGRLECIEPHPSSALAAGFPGLARLHSRRVEDIGLEPFLALAAGDILFIDSSHCCRIGGDVNFLFLEVLPRLQPGVVVHVHDIYLPLEYREEWVKESHLFWTEQYLLQAFLAFNSAFEVLFANTYMAHRHGRRVAEVFPGSPWVGGGSFWMRRKGG